MKTQDAIKYFKTQRALAEALGCAQSSVSEWGEYPPDGRQFQIEILTNKELKVEDYLIPKPFNTKAAA